MRPAEEVLLAGICVDDRQCFALVNDRHRKQGSKVLARTRCSKELVFRDIRTQVWALVFGNPPGDAIVTDLVNRLLGSTNSGPAEPGFDLKYSSLIMHKHEGPSVGPACHQSNIQDLVEHAVQRLVRINEDALLRRVSHTGSVVDVPIRVVLFGEGFESNLLQLVEGGEALAQGVFVAGVAEGAEDMGVLVARQAVGVGHHGVNGGADGPVGVGGLRL